MAHGRAGTGTWTRTLILPVCVLSRHRACARGIVHATHSRIVCVSCFRSLCAQTDDARPSAGTDIVGYTSLSEKVEPERVMKMLHGEWDKSVECHASVWIDNAVQLC